MTETETTEEADATGIDVKTTVNQDLPINKLLRLKNRRKTAILTRPA